MLWKRILFAYLVVAVIAFVVGMVPVTKQFGKRAFWPQTLNAAKHGVLWPYVAFRQVVRF